MMFCGFSQISTATLAINELRVGSLFDRDGRGRGRGGGESGQEEA